MDLVTIGTLGFVAMLAGFVDAIAGGGGLITLPAILLAGVDPVAAIATNKLQAASATLSATVAFARRGLIEWRKGLPMAVMAFTGGVIGAISVSLLPEALLMGIVPILLILVALFFARSPKLDEINNRPKVSFFVFGLLFAPVLGFYDGIFGPGTGSFFLIGFIYFLGIKLIPAMSYTKLANVSSNLGSLCVFLVKGAIMFPLAITMAIGAIIGAQIGAYCAVRFGSRLVKPVLILVSLIMALKLLIDPNNPLGSFIRHLFT